MNPYEAFIDSIDNKENFQIVELEFKDPALYNYAIINYSMFEDSAPIMKIFYREPNRSPLRLSAGKHKIIEHINGDRYYFDAEVRAWYQF